MWLDPTNKNRFYVGQDGGASLTYDHGKTLDLLRQSVLRPVLRGQRRHARSVLRLWRPAGQRHLGRPVDEPGGHDPDRLLVQRRRRRRLPHPERPDRLAHRLRREPGRLGPADERRDARDHAASGPRPQNIVNYKDFFPGAGRRRPAQAGRRGDAAARADGARPRRPAACAAPLRFNWSTPIYLSPHNPQHALLRAATTSSSRWTAATTG